MLLFHVNRMNAGDCGVSSSNRRTARSARRGFTLVELLVVIAIIALLLAILLPSLQKAKYQARVIACMSRVRGMAVAITAYTNSYDGYYPDGPHGRRGPENIYLGGSTAEAYDLRPALRDYFGTQDLNKFMMCPLSEGPWLPKYPVYPNIDKGDKSPYAFYFGQEVYAFNPSVGAHWIRSDVMLRVNDTWSPGQNNTDMKFDWLLSDFVYYNGFGGFGGTFMATTHVDANGSAPPAGSYLDHNLGTGYRGGEMGNANFARADGSAGNYTQIGEGAVFTGQIIGVRRQATQSYFVPSNWLQ